MPRILQNKEEEFPQLTALELKACPVRGDGNCLFYSLSDQLHGDQNRHQEIRQAVVRYMREHPDSFKPWINVEGNRRTKRRITRSTSSRFTFRGATEEQTERAWEDYLECMAQDGTYGDHLEITAFAKAYCTDVMIFRQYGNPPEPISAYDDNIPRPTVYIAHHLSWEHYSSIRNLNGPFTRPPEVRHNISAMAIPELDRAKVRKVQEEQYGNDLMVYEDNDAASSYSASTTSSFESTPPPRFTMKSKLRMKQNGPQPKPRRCRMKLSKRNNAIHNCPATSTTSLFSSRNSDPMLQFIGMKTLSI